MNPAILLHWTQPLLLHCSVILWFNYSKLSHFTQSICDLVSPFTTPNSAIFAAMLRSAIFLQHSVILWPWQSFCYIKLSHFCYNAHISNFSTVLSHSKILSAIWLHWTQTFLLSAIFLQYLVTLRSCQPFYYTKLSHFCYNARISHIFYSTQSFCNIVSILPQWTQHFSILLSYFSQLSHSATVNSVILLQWTQSLCYRELNHFALVLGHFMIFSSILEILSAIFHCYSAQSFHVAIVH
jgi:hypothetical protein